MSKEIDFTDPKCTETLTTGLNHYSATFGFPESKRWSLDFLKKNFPDEAERLAGVAPERFSNRGYVCRMMHKGLRLPQETRDDLIKFFKEISTEPKPVEEVDSAEPKTRKKVKITTNPVIYQLEDVQDAILTDQEPKPVTVPADTAVVTEAKVWIEKEVLDVSEQIVKFKAMLDALEDVYGRCGGVVKGLKRKPAKPAKPAKVVKIEKIKTAIKVNAELRYQEVDEETKVASLAPSKVIGAKRVMLYDGKYKAATLLVAATDAGLTISGQQIGNFDPDASSSRAVRHPKDFVTATNPFIEYNVLTSKLRLTIGKVMASQIFLAVE